MASWRTRRRYADLLELCGVVEPRDLVRPLEAGVGPIPALLEFVGLLTFDDGNLCGLSVKVTSGHALALERIELVEQLGRAGDRGPERLDPAP